MGILDQADPTSNISSNVDETLLNATQSSLSSSLATSSAGQISFSSLGDFQAKYPQLYQQFMLSVAYQICSQMQSDSERFVANQKRAQQEDH